MRVRKIFGFLSAHVFSRVWVGGGGGGVGVTWWGTPDEEGFGAQGSDLELDFDVDELLGEEFEDFDELESFYEALSDGEELPDDVVEVIPAEVDPETGETIKKRMVRRVRPSKGGGGVPKKQTAASIGQQQGISEELARELQERLEKRRLAKQLMQDPEGDSLWLSPTCSLWGLVELRLLPHTQFCLSP